MHVGGECFKCCVHPQAHKKYENLLERKLVDLIKYELRYSFVFHPRFEHAWKRTCRILRMRLEITRCEYYLTRFAIKPAMTQKGYCVRKGWVTKSDNRIDTTAEMAGSHACAQGSEGPPQFGEPFFCLPITRENDIQNESKHIFSKRQIRAGCRLLPGELCKRIKKNFGDTIRTLKQKLTTTGRNSTPHLAGAQIDCWVQGREPIMKL